MGVSLLRTSCSGLRVRLALHPGIEPGSNAWAREGCALFTRPYRPSLLGLMEYAGIWDSEVKMSHVFQPGYAQHEGRQEHGNIILKPKTMGEKNGSPCWDFMIFMVKMLVHGVNSDFESHTTDQVQLPRVLWALQSLWMHPTQLQFSKFLTANFWWTWEKYCWKMRAIIISTITVSIYTRYNCDIPWFSLFLVHHGNDFPDFPPNRPGLARPLRALGRKRGTARCFWARRRTTSPRWIHGASWRIQHDISIVNFSYPLVI